MEQEISAMWAQVVATAGVGVLQCGLIGWGLWEMRQSGARRDRQLDALLKGLERQGETTAQAFTQQGQVLAELLRRTA